MSQKKLVDSLPTEIEENEIYIINQNNPNSYTHNLFKYPCKFIPEIPRWAIKTYLTSVKNVTVLDPFAGSGTTLLEAGLFGCKSIGTEIDDLAKMLIRVKTQPLTESQIKYVEDFIIKIKEEKNVPIQKESVVLPEINNLDHWFEPCVSERLGYIYYCICKIDDVSVKEFLLICFASIIKRVSNCDDISPKPYVSNNVKKQIPQVTDTFVDVANKYIESIRTISKMKIKRPLVNGDATHIHAKDCSIDLAVTSPPYINAFDYVRTLRLENLWLHLSTEENLRTKKRQYIGTECISTKNERDSLDILNESDLLLDYYNSIKVVDEKRALIMKKFFEEMKANLAEVLRVLKNDGKYVIVIGDSSIRNVHVESWKVLKEIAMNLGYKYVNHIGYEIKNPYIRIPRGGKGGKIDIDHILVLEK